MTPLCQEEGTCFPSAWSRVTGTHFLSHRSPKKRLPCSLEGWRGEGKRRSWGDGVPGASNSTCLYEGETGGPEMWVLWSKKRSK